MFRDYLSDYLFLLREKGFPFIFDKIIFVRIKYLTAIFFLFGFVALSEAQTYLYKGLVKDKNNRSPLAFVNIVSDNGFGATTDIDGKFEIRLNENSSALHLSYIGYEPLSMAVDSSEELHYIYLMPKIFHLREVEVFPGINPAHRIIDSVLSHRDENDPRKIKKFTYVSYDKMNITVEADSLMAMDTAAMDTNQRRLRGLLKKQDIFLLETVSERKYMAPDLNQETVLATRVSGFKDPVVAFMISQLQSTSFMSPR